MLTSIDVSVVPHKDVLGDLNQRYDTVGDWQFVRDHVGADHLEITVSDTGDERYNMLIAVHEIVEALLCRANCIEQKDVDRFDLSFEEARPEGDICEPGDDAKAPYRNEHCFATAVERMLCAAYGIAWADYDAAILTLL
jgi:hypothetical protein